MSEESRQHPRFRVALRAHLALGPSLGGTVTTTTTSVSRTGMSVKLASPPAIDSITRVTLELPNGSSVDGKAICKNHLPGFTCGFVLVFFNDAQELWDSFIDEEESTGSLWRMIGRIAAAPDDAFAPRGMRERVDADDLKFHTAGENGEAYRVAFEKHAWDDALACDLSSSLPGFASLAARLVKRVLRAPMTLRVDDGKLVTARVAELLRGGYAYVQGASPSITGADTPTGLVALGAGELVLVSKNGKSVFPHYTDADLERIACDTFRRDLGRPVFTPARGVARPAPVQLPPMPTLPAKFREGLDAVRFAQAADDGVQIRRYGDRDVFFHPSIWARVSESGSELMGPTLHDGHRICVLALVGPGAPRVVRLEDASKVSLLKRPK